MSRWSPGGFCEGRFGARLFARRDAEASTIEPRLGLVEVVDPMVRLTHSVGRPLVVATVPRLRQVVAVTAMPWWAIVFIDVRAGRSACLSCSRFCCRSTVTSEAP